MGQPSWQWLAWGLRVEFQTMRPHLTNLDGCRRLLWSMPCMMSVQGPMVSGERLKQFVGVEHLFQQFGSFAGNCVIVLAGLWDRWWELRDHLVNVQGHLEDSQEHIGTVV